MRQYSGRRYRRRFFRKRPRKKTEWIQGFDQLFTNAIGLNPVFKDVAGNLICHSTGFNLFGSAADFDAFESGFMVNRFVGDWDVYICTGTDGANLSQDGAEIRLSYQRQRVYPTHFLTGPPTSITGDDVRLHSCMFVGSEMGDEEIYWTRRLLQPKYEGTALGSLVPLSGSPIATQFDNPFLTVLGGMSVQKTTQGLPFCDITARHRVHTDSPIFLYIDVTRADGTPFNAVTPVFARFSGYGRCLITPL